MKTWKLISLLLVFFIFGACDDDVSDCPDAGGGGSATVSEVNACWGYESKTVLKNSGQILVPIKLDRASGNMLKVTVSAQQSDDEMIAREGVDFEIRDKVVNFPAGDTLAFLPVDLIDNGKAEKDRDIILHLSGVYSGKISTPKTCSLHIVNNAFVEFQYKNRETYEAAGTYKIPVLVTGDILENTTFTVRVKEGGTAQEGTHFNLPKTTYTLEKGATAAEVEIELVDDDETNTDRWFDLEIVAVNGSNAIIGKSIPVCRVTIISEEVLRFVAFDASEYSVEEGKDLRIPIVLDKAPGNGEADVEVTFSVKTANSTAVEGIDFTIEEKTLRFVPGQKENELVVHILDNDWIDVDRNFVLSFRESQGANIGTPDVCQVTIRNNDFPVFAQNSYMLEEDYGELILPVELPSVSSTDTRLTVKVLAGEAAKEGKHYTLPLSEILIPAGQTTGEVRVNIGHDLEWEQTPVFTVYIAQANGVVLKESDCAAVISLQPCDYRKFLGTWYLTSLKPEAMKTNCEIVVSAGENGEDFNKRYVCNTAAGALTSNSAAAFEWHMNYDKNTGAIQLVMGEKINLGGNLSMSGKSIYITWYYYGNQTTKYIETTWDGDDTLLWNSGNNYVCLACIGVNDGSWVGQVAWHLENVKMVRK